MAWLVEGGRDLPPPYFGVGKHKRTCFRSELEGYYWVFAPTKGTRGLKIGHMVYGILYNVPCFLTSGLDALHIA